eukprot:6371248-Prymnesium_polylepis.1
MEIGVWHIMIQLYQAALLCVKKNSLEHLDAVGERMWTGDHCCTPTTSDKVSATPTEQLSSRR